MMTRSWSQKASCDQRHTSYCSQQSHAEAEAEEAYSLRVGGTLTHCCVAELCCVYVEMYNIYMFDATADS